MRITHVTPLYTPVIGGVEDVVKHITEHMASRGHEVYVITYNRLRTGAIGTLPREEEVNGVHIIRLKPTITWSHGSYSPELPNVMRSLKPDIVHVHVWRHPHVFQIAKLRREMKFKAILHGHAPFHKLNQLGPITWTYHRLVDNTLKGVLRNYDTYIALTNHEKEIVTKKLGLSEDKVIIVPNGIEEDRCKPNNERDDTVLYLGRISRAKNVQLLIKAMNIVKDEVKDAELIMAGPDEGLINQLINYADRHGIKMKYLGVVDEEQKHELYLRSRVYALPSTYEPFGITLLEAGIHATPSTITGNGGQLHAAPPEKASLWTEPKPEKYAKTITQLLTDDELWKKLSQGAYEHAKNLTWNKILPLYERLYTE
ncbi:glycosyltransferase family 4 protein [Vulcanisaeta souniana]|uniref:Glycosyl transferase n=1 Tax=Vulcanisaeta souniana JCM 11219 TaxID=1293586 RepID=A0A830EHV0_9CREN|nr:glycosyltransferase family 4 protein [Vulcanisaeta souniana]BDR92707.1 glycosyl transferase [Vulcanisaeta souniana JCM 11219]GGI84276.1 glycosyl transferase [Vulcanisaeta souniana JCM 11219]